MLTHNTMLAGVQHQQQAATGERLCQALHRRLAAEFQPDRGGDRGRNQAEIGKRRELGQPNPVGKSRSKGEAHRQRRGFRAGTQKPVECMRRIVFLLYQKGRDSRIFQAQDRAIDDFTLIGGARAQRGTADKTRLIIGCGDCTNSFMR